MDGQTFSFIGVACRSRATPGSTISYQNDGSIRLAIPAGPTGKYRLAQLDDTLSISRSRFHWQVPFKFSLRARVSAETLPGTWGVGLWNDPFMAALSLGGGLRALPALPNTAWFFHASDRNYLSLRDDQPGNGFLAAVFSSPLTPLLLLSPAVIGIPLLAWPASARWIRKISRRFIHDDSFRLEVDVCQWHDYRIESDSSGCMFFVDGKMVSSSPFAPSGRLGLVIWIDNQYAAFTPQGQLGYGTQENSEPAWLDIDQVSLQEG